MKASHCEEWASIHSRRSFMLSSISMIDQGWRHSWGPLRSPFTYWSRLLIKIDQSRLLRDVSPDLATQTMGLSSRLGRIDFAIGSIEQARILGHPDQPLGPVVSNQSDWPFVTIGNIVSPDQSFWFCPDIDIMVCSEGSGNLAHLSMLANLNKLRVLTV